MDCGKILRRAGEITWQWKGLWLLGLLISLCYLIGSFVLIRIGLPNPQHASTGELPAWFSVATCLGLVGSLLSAIVWLIAQGGLIAGVQHAADGGRTSFPLAWRAGLRHFWALFGIAFLAASPLVVTLFLTFCATTALGLGLAVSDPAAASQDIFRVAIPIFSAIILLTTAVVYVVFALASRGAVLEDLGWVEAFRCGTQAFRNNLGRIVLLGLVLLALRTLVGAVTGAAVLATLLSASGSGLAEQMWNTPAWAIAITALLGLALGAVLETYASAVWTLAYRHLAGLEWTPGIPFVGGPPLRE